VASGVDATLRIFSHVAYRGALADVQTVSCGEATLPQQEKHALSQ
jgi:hypothetical protein